MKLNEILAYATLGSLLVTTSLAAKTLYNFKSYNSSSIEVQAEKIYNTNKDLGAALCSGVVTALLAAGTMYTKKGNNFFSNGKTVNDLERELLGQNQKGN